MSVIMDGKVVYLSKKFWEFLGIEEVEIRGVFVDLMSVKEGE